MRWLRRLWAALLNRKASAPLVLISIDPPLDYSSGWMERTGWDDPWPM